MSGMSRALAHILFRHGKVAGAVFGGSILVATVASFALPPVYRSEATVVVKFGDAAAKGDARLQAQAMAAQIDLLHSPDMHERVVEAVGPGKLYPALSSSAGGGPVEAAAAAFGRDLSVHQRDGGLIDLSLSGESPQATAQALNALIEIFRERQGQLLQRSVMDNPAEQVFTMQLDAARERLTAFRNQYKVYDIERQREFLLRQRSQLDADLRAVRHEVEAHAAKMRTLKVQLDSTPKTVALSMEPERNGPLDDARAKLLELQIKEQELLAKYREDSQFVHTVRAEMRQVKEFLSRMENSPAARTRQGVNEVYLQIEKESNTTQALLNAARTRAETMSAQLTEMDGEIATLASRERHLAELERDLKVAEDNAAAYQRRTQDSRADEAVERAANVGVIANAAVPRDPVRPRPLLYMALGLLIGTLGALAAAIGLERASRQFSSAQAVERRLGLPVLAAIDYRG